MLFLSNPGSMANVFLLSNRFLPRGRFFNNNIPPFPFLFALSFPVFLFHFLFFSRRKNFYRWKQCQYRSISSKLYRALSILFIFLRDIGSPIPRNFHANICIPSQFARQLIPRGRLETDIQVNSYNVGIQCTSIVSGMAGPNYNTGVSVADHENRGRTSMVHLPAGHSHLLYYF